MAEICREFGISRKTHYKIIDRYQQCGMQGLAARSRPPCRYTNLLPFQAENYFPFQDKTIPVNRCGRICLGKKKINSNQVFATQAVGNKEVHDDIWLVSFMDYDLGYIDLEERTLQPSKNPFGPKV
jgi:hypothetical protein